MLLIFIIPFKKIFFPADNNHSNTFQSGLKKILDILAASISDISFTIFMKHMEEVCEPVNRKKMRIWRGDGNVLPGKQFL